LTEQSAAHRFFSLESLYEAAAICSASRASDEKAMQASASILRSLAFAAILTASAALGPLAVSAPVFAQETAVAPEKNPPGDIPDNQVFITYKSPQGFSLKVPEGWARKEAPAGVSFADKYGRIEVTVALSATPPTAASARSSEAANRNEMRNAEIGGAVV
jgi:hypothetical protein